MTPEETKDAAPKPVARKPKTAAVSAPKKRRKASPMMLLRSKYKSYCKFKGLPKSEQDSHWLSFLAGAECAGGL